MSLTVQLVGVRETQQALRDISAAIHRKHLRIALNKGGGMLKTTAMQFATVDSGLLRRSLRVKVVIPNNKPAAAVVGPGRNMGRMMRRTAGGRVRGHAKAQKAFLETVKLSRGAGGRGREPVRAAKAFVGQTYSEATYRNPSRYAHLVEKGFRHRGGGFVKARPFLSVAARVTGPAAQQAVVQKLQEGLRVEGAKAYARRRVA